MDGDSSGVLLAPGSQTPFEALKQINEHGAEYWSARGIQPLLGYTKWPNFHASVKKAIDSCRQSGNTPEHHFASAGKMIAVGKGGVRETPDYHLSRFACYLIAQNGDPRKPEVAEAQKYFAIQTRRMEMTDQLAADRERLELREQMSEEVKALNGAARQAGVQDRMFGLFHDAGYRGMYGRGLEATKEKKGIGKKELLLDRIGTTELAANTFRITQTRDKLARDKIRDQQAAIHAHETVGREVREAIRKIGGTMPENLPAEEHIKVVKKRLKSSKPKIALSEEDAKGLLPSPATQLSVDDL